MSDENLLQPKEASEFQILSDAEKYQNLLQIIDENIRHDYLTRLSEMEIVPLSEELQTLEDDIIENIRLYKITEMVYQKGEPVTDKFTTIFNTLSTYKSSVFILLDSNGEKTDFYLGVRSNGDKRSIVTLGNTLKSTLIGHFPGAKIKGENRKSVMKLSQSIQNRHNVASVSVVGNSKLAQQTNENFVQGLEKLALAMQGKTYTGVIIAQNTQEVIPQMRQEFQNLYTNLSSLQKVQITDNTSVSESKQQSFTEMNGKQKAAMISSAVLSLAGGIGGAFLGASGGVSKLFASGSQAGLGAMLGGQVFGQLGGFLNSLAPNSTKTTTDSKSQTTTTENKAVTDMLQLIDSNLKRINEFDSYGMWNVAGYFISDDMSAAEIAASNYRSLMNGENSGRDVSAINSWRSDTTNFQNLTTYLAHFNHPGFIYGGNIVTTASTAVSGKELGLHLGLPRKAVPGLPVIEHAEFGKEVYIYDLNRTQEENIAPENRLTLGKIFDLGQTTDKVVELHNQSLTMHTFITGSTGSGKSNTVYQMVNELHQDNIPFLIIEPAKGEYKDVFGHFSDVHVFSTNPKISELIRINPFKFPENVHVLEHIDGLVEIFSACWPMYDAMPAFFKNAMTNAYQTVGWDLGTSTFEGEIPEYPDFSLLEEELEMLVQQSAYSDEVKGNYTGALITRVHSLATGLNKYIFTTEQTPYEMLFDENCILDLSHVKSGEAKALIMGLMVYQLNEYRSSQKKNANTYLRHVTVLEEAHNLLKNQSGGESSALQSKSIEMITNTIAEIRTFGEGVIIVDQSPSSVDVAAIKNTNTKIVLRTPESNDRDAVGRSMGLTENQVNEIAKLPSGVAVVYQNDWMSPVLTRINKADIVEKVYQYEQTKPIKTIKDAREDILAVLLMPWVKGNKISKSSFDEAIESLEISRRTKLDLREVFAIYEAHQGKLIWRGYKIPALQELIRGIIGIENFDNINEKPFSEEIRQAIEMVLNLEVVD
ncbi:DUF87 domain-containing protein [Lactococcus hircilactis]|uniref:DUF87 domain-containing protein n=1 Tax=Lactococcus hircilactis TaxID=1494462 RepID=A0A7X2D275_9LACT|nr:ATP-binding protein [Lactococcus hircilactis]MQW39790.1 DUF87 domain-containing protein [Lactococcus hircilactis]